MAAIAKKEKPCLLQQEARMKKVVVSPYFIDKKTKKEKERVMSPYLGVEDASKKMKMKMKMKKKRVVSPYFSLESDINNNTGGSPKKTLSAAEKRDEAYRRRTPDNTWKPPPSERGLLQHPHADDPWKVLLICMLLNRTTGKQAKQILEDLFTLCPNAKAATGCHGGDREDHSTSWLATEEVGDDTALLSRVSGRQLDPRHSVAWHWQVCSGCICDILYREVGSCEA